ncbi:MAG: hypothetical protein GY703_15805 [Gammaproteobacteria bacterium]|nr:hypothetical protein [Gammaproteobacteria bacterium]
MNSAPAEKEEKSHRSPLLGILLSIIVLIGIVSQVTAVALGQRTESVIQQEQQQLEAIASKYADLILGITLGTNSKPAGFTNILKHHFQIIPAMNDNDLIFQWFKKHGAAMSNFRRKRIELLIKEGREEFQTEFVTMRELKQAYHESLDSLYLGFWLELNDYPKVAMNSKFDPQQWGL